MASEALEAEEPVELRDRWLNPPVWVEWVNEPVPGYPQRPIPRDEDAPKALRKRTLTSLYPHRNGSLMRTKRLTPPWLPRTVAPQTSAAVEIVDTSQ